AFFAEVDTARGGDRRLDAFVGELRGELSRFDDIEVRARRVVEHMALALQAALLVRVADAKVADAFCASRLARDRGLAFGTLPADVDCAYLIERARPQLKPPRRSSPQRHQDTNPCRLARSRLHQLSRGVGAGRVGSTLDDHHIGRFAADVEAAYYLV